MLKTYAVPAVAPGTGEGDEKAISGLITRVGIEVSVTGSPTPLLAVAATTMNLPSSEIVDVYVEDVAPEIFVQVVGSFATSQTFH